MHTKKAELPELEIRLYRWFLAQRERNMPVSGDLIRQKALSLSVSLSVAGFKASDGWLQHFKQRHGVRLLKISGEKLSSQPELIDPFKARLRRVIQEHNLNEHQLYNADETGLYWQLLPDKTYVALAEKNSS
ncbi:jerky protein homolog [Sitophilus oryzae]|uniref:Jerky protein homolog n=1 Tax=Sitophilus oryzae TaxID=7048 RepID=A0A6J2YQV2_SITOR|nr:jerky protein homolog [Sitophilus oryzae]